MCFFDDLCSNYYAYGASNINAESNDMFDDGHIALILVLMLLVAVFCLYFFILRKQIRDTKNNYDISMSKLGKTVGLYDIAHKTLYLPKPYASEHDIPYKITNMPEAFLDIMKDRIDEESYQRLESYIECIVSGNESKPLNIRIKARIDKNERWLNMDYHTIFKNGKPVQAYISLSDSTLEHARILAFERFKLMTESKSSMVSFDYSLLDVTDDCVDTASGRLVPGCSLNGLNIEEYHQELKGMRLYNEKGESILEALSRERLIEYYKNGQYVIEDTWSGISILNNQVWIVLTAKIIKDPFDEHIRCYLEYKDVTDQKLKENQLRERSIRDGMTKLYNQATTKEFVENSIKSNENAVHVLAFFDLDGLKSVNDNFGHLEGDRIIKGFSNRLISEFGNGFVVGRMGGDEFAVYTCSIDDIDELKARFDSFVATLDLSVMQEKKNTKITCSCGVVIGTDEDYEKSYKQIYIDLFKKADAALYKAKALGKNNVVYFDDSIPIRKEESSSYSGEINSKTASEIFSYLFENFMYFAAEDTFLSSDKDVLILTDAATHKIEYINMKNKSDIDRYFPNWGNAKCYELIYQKDSPCEDCRIYDSDRNVISARKYSCPQLKLDDCMMVDRVNIRGEKDTYLHYIKNTNDPSYASDISNKSTIALHLLRYCVDISIRHNNVKDTFNEIISVLCKHFNGDFGYISIFNKDIDVQYFGGETRRDKPVWEPIIEDMYNLYNSSSIICLEDTKVLKDENQKSYKFFSERNTKSLVIFPITDEGILYGYIYIENFRTNKTSFTVMYEISSLLVNCLIKYSINEQTLKNDHMPKTKNMYNYVDEASVKNTDALAENAVNAIYEALKKDQIEVYFQPKLKLETRKVERTIYAEALSRWIKDGKIFSMPSEFIAVLKATGGLVEFDLYIFEKVCERISQLAEKGLDDIVIAVNITEETALSPNVVKIYEKIRKKYNVSASSIELEISENVLYVNSDAISNVIDEFRKKGYLCTLDDFGVEKSTLFLLHKTLVDAIKLDRKFFKSNTNRAKQNIVVKNLIGLADELDIAVICEGVERQEEIDFLREAGCEYVQGFYHQRPMNFDSFIDYVKAQREGCL